MTERAYTPTKVGAVEVKRLPPAQTFESRGKGLREMFREDFRFLKANDLRMTTPVERDLGRPAMRFFVPSSRAGRPFRPTPGVEVRDLGERTVVSAGLRGGYSIKRIRKGERRVRRWLVKHPEYRALGPATGVYWNGPIVPPFLRRMEVHVPVEHSG